MSPQTYFRFHRRFGVKIRRDIPFMCDQKCSEAERCHKDRNQEWKFEQKRHSEKLSLCYTGVAIIAGAVSAENHHFVPFIGTSIKFRKYVVNIIY